MSTYTSKYFKNGEQLDEALKRASSAVSYDAQVLSDAQQLQVRTNIGAASAEKVSRLSEEKVGANQGAENAGKVLGIGTDGKVVPVNAPSSGVDESDAYELIESVTLTEKANLYRGSEPDGTPYRFKKVKVLIIIPANSEETSQTTLFYSNNGVMVYVYGGVSEVEGGPIYAEIKKEKDCWAMLYTPYTYNSTYSNLAIPQGAAVDPIYTPDAFGDYIQTVFINTTMPVGTIIKIWGVRADA